MFIEFLSDRTTHHLDRQYMLGDDLLVAPVMSADGEVSYYVPAGRWERFDGSGAVEGPAWITERHGFDSAPLLVRPGAVITLGARTDRPDYTYEDGVTLRLYAPIEPRTVRVGASTFTVTADGVTRDGPELPWRVEIVGGPSADLPAETSHWTAG